MSVKSVRWPLWAVLLAILVAPLTWGCSRYDSYERNMERNMRYVSSEVLVSESKVAFERLRAAHDAWRVSSRPEALDTFRDMYGQYEVIYNELMDRAGGRLINHLAKFAELMPPPPPGVAIEGLPTTPLPTPVPRDGGPGPEPQDRIAPVRPAKAEQPPRVVVPAPGDQAAPDPDQPAAPAKAATPKKSAKPAKSGKSNQSDDPADSPQVPATGPGKPEATGPDARDDRQAEAGPDAEAYVLRPGDTPHQLANRFRVSEARLLEVNAIADPQRLVVGRKLLIPKD